MRLTFILAASILTACSTPLTQPEQAETPDAASLSGDANYPAALLVDIDTTVALVEEALEPEAPTDVWQRIREGFSLADTEEHPRLQRELDWYVRHPAYMQRVAERATPYMHYVIDTIEENNLPSELALLPIVESAFQPFAYSHGRAAGIWQFIPSTGRQTLNNFTTYFPVNALAKSVCISCLIHIYGTSIAM